MNKKTNKLKDDTKEWQQETSPRLITANEVATIVGQTTWNYKTSTGGYWFKGNSNKIDAGTGPYAWLYSYLKNCEEYGCNKQDYGASWGYWTSDRQAGSSFYAWRVGRDSTLGNSGVNNTGYGVRPVITLSKSKLA